MTERYSPLPEEYPATLSFSEVLDRWVRREGNRYASILVERGFLRVEDQADPRCIYEATKQWRLTYVQDLGLESCLWKREEVSHVPDILEWRLGGWRGWLPYRPEGARFTTFRDVARGIDDLAHPDIPAHHRTGLPEIAAGIINTLKTKDLFLLRCGFDTAALDGTHTLSGLAYALTHGLPVSSSLFVYVCSFSEAERERFEAFCISRPLVHGPYKVP